MKYPVELSTPKNPVLAETPLCHLYSIPRSLPSSTVRGVVPPKVNTGSLIVTTVDSTLVVVPLTIKSPPIERLPVVLIPAKFAVPVNVGDPLNTRKPVPVSSETAERICSLVALNVLFAKLIVLFVNVSAPAKEANVCDDEIGIDAVFSPIAN